MQKYKLYLIMGIVAALVLSESNAHCQTLVPRFGVTLSKSSLSGDDMPSHDVQVDFKQGFLIGVAYKHVMTERTSLQVELSYAQKGQKVKLKSKSPDHVYIDHRNFFIEYIEFPVSANVNIARRPKFDSYLIGGINVSYWIGGKVDVDVYVDMPGANPYQYSETWPIKYDNSASGTAGDTFYITNRFDLGLQAGFGLFLLDKFIVDIRYVISFYEIEFYEDALAGNRMLQFSVGVPIKLKSNK